MIESSWFQCLGEDYRWLTEYQNNVDLLSAVDRILESDEFIGVTEVYQSSVWAICHAYIDYRLGTSFLSTEELEYTRGRSGVIGVSATDENVQIATLRFFLEEYDPGFAFFLSEHNGPPAA